MAEAFLTVVVENLGSLIKEEMGLILGVDKEMKKLCSTLTTIQAVLEDAELRQIESRPIRDWVCKLNAIACEIDDILDDCNTHLSKLNHSAPTTLTRYSLNKILYRSKIGKRMKQVKENLDCVAAESAQFHLREMPVGVGRPREVAAASRETGSMLNEPELIYGRDEDRDKIVKMLVDDDAVRENQQLSVLPIIGVGGLGKTTLAQLVFNDPLIQNHFEKRIWVCVSDDFDIKTLVKAMIESGRGNGKASDLQHLDSLQRSLWELLSQKRYLVVLDDVWNDQQQKWFELKDILSCGSTGSSIIVTTRLKKVADIMGTLPPHCLRGLLDEHCWMLLRKRAFGQEEVHPALELIGKQIVKKCAGVPLAAKALGGILRFKRTEKEWMHVRESDIWKLSPEDSLIMPALRLSYHHLPLELRQCFAYFAAFPKDYRVGKEELIRLWMAHGFISSKGALQVEDVGNEICNELILRSLLQQTLRSQISMHDLIHDLAQSVMENKVPGIQMERNISNTTASITIRQVNLRRRIVLFPKTLQQDMNISSIMMLTSLRVLDASHTKLNDLPPSVNNLKHMRYLNLSFSQIRTLPNSLCTLWNLQILNLDHCRMLVALPKNTRKLRNLRHLCLRNCKSLSEMPSRMRELTHLKTLSMFVVGLNRGNKLEELQCLNLNGRLDIHHLERVEDRLDAQQANIVEKMNLQDLSLRWERNTSSKLSQELDEQVLEALEPHINLESLSIIGFSGRYFPTWMTNTTLRRIVEIDIRDCRNCSRLPKLGQLPHLKRLILTNVGVKYIIEDEVRSRDSENIQFLALDTLHLTDLPKLKMLSKEQESEEAFPNLKELLIDGCPSLTLTPISSLKTLKDLTCNSSILGSFSEMDSITTLMVNIEKRMVCFPLETVTKFSNLQSLVICGVQDISMPAEVQSLQYLKSLYIEVCTTRIPEGLLGHFTSLKELNISFCPKLVELPEEIKHLHNLEMIVLWSLPKIMCLPRVLQHLPSLRMLMLNYLPQLESLPELLQHLTSLWLFGCPKVVSIPALQNLKELTVVECPQLERRCERGNGEYWHNIAHIPRLKIGRS